MMSSRSAVRLAMAALVLAAFVSGCAENPPPVAGTPKFSEYPKLVVPAALKPTADTTRALDDAWQRLQTGDLSGARSGYQAILKRTPEFYPAETGLGLVALAGRDYKEANARFTAALARNRQYLPALVGAAEVDMGAGDDAAAVVMLQAVVKLDPTRESAKSRLEMLRVRLVQQQIDDGRKAREAGRFDDAQTAFERALTTTPDNPLVLRELALVELGRGRFPVAESRIRQALQIDADDAEAYALLGEVLEREGKFGDAADAYGRAVAIDPRAGWRDKRNALRQKADEAALPSDFRAIASAPRATRADVAAMIGLKLGDVLARSTRHIAVVATDVRGHWAAQWIVPVTQAGLMDVLPNHTFQPEASIRRRDFAQIVADLIGLFGAERAADVSRWKSARPRFSDLAGPGGAYQAAALAVAAGVMTPDGDRFSPDRALTGAELSTAVARLQQIAAR